MLMAELARVSGWRSRDVLRAAAIVVGLIVTLWFLWVVRSVVCLAFLGVLFGLALGAGADRLESWRGPPGAGGPPLGPLLLGAVGGGAAPPPPRNTPPLQEGRQPGAPANRGGG